MNRILLPSGFHGIEVENNAVLLRFLRASLLARRCFEPIHFLNSKVSTLNVYDSKEVSTTHIVKHDVFFIYKRHSVYSTLAYMGIVKLFKC